MPSSQPLPDKVKLLMTISPSPYFYPMASSQQESLPEKVSTIINGHVTLEVESSLGFDYIETTFISLP